MHTISSLPSVGFDPAILRILRWSDLVVLNNDGDLTAPSWLAWDAQGERLALGYESFVAILGSNPVLALKTSVPMRGSTGGVWNGAEVPLIRSDLFKPCAYSPSHWHVIPIGENSGLLEQHA